MRAWLFVLPGQLQTRDRDPRAGDGEPDDDLGEIGAVVVRVAEAAEAGLARGTLVRLVEL
jgi:hypothetical protein